MPLHIPVLSPGAGLMHSPTGRVVCSVARHRQAGLMMTCKAGLTVCVCVQCCTTSILIMDSASPLACSLIRDHLREREREREACISAKGRIGGGKWRELAPQCSGCLAL